MEIKKVCFFGIYDPEYSRNRVLIKGFKANGVEIIECNSRLSGVKKYFDLIKKHWHLRGKYDVLLVAYPGFQSMILARFITSKPIVYDSFYSIYNQATEDRKTLGKFSIQASYYWLLDWLACTLADKILLDTNTHIEYFVKKFGLKRGKFLRVFVGTDSEVFYPREFIKNNGFLVHFHGHFIPLQGVEYIIRAAHILKNKGITFQIIGSGQEYLRVRKIAENLELDNINWITKVPYANLPEHISRADVCLGIFGDTIKADMVIPNKIFESIAMAKPTITANTLAIREMFEDGKNVLLCVRSNSEDLANKILEIKNNHELRKIIAQNGHELFLEKCTPKAIVSDLLHKINE